MCHPINVTKMSEGTEPPLVFYRLVLQIKDDPKLDNKLAKAKQKLVLTTDSQRSRCRIQESGLVLFQALEFFLGFQTPSSTINRVQKFLEYPLLQFNTSSFLRSEIFPHINAELKRLWTSVLPDSKYVFHLFVSLSLYKKFLTQPFFCGRFDEVTLKEAKKILIELLLAGPYSKHVALAETRHIRQINLLSEKRILIKSFSVEKSNYNALLRSLDALNSTSIVLCIINVSG